MSITALNDFLNNYVAPNPVPELESICEDLKRTYVDDSEDTPRLPETKKQKHEEQQEEKISPTVAKTPPPLDPGPSPLLPPGVLIAHGVLTEGGKVPIIDDEHTVRLAIQTIPAEKLIKGRNVRYSYVDKDDFRKDIKILEVLETAPPVTPVPVPSLEQRMEVEVKEVAPIRPPESIPESIEPAPFPQPEEAGTKQLKGQVRNLRTVGDLTAVEVEFEDGTVEVIPLTTENCDQDYRPVAHDTIVVHFKLPSEDDEDEEDQATISKILPATIQSGAGTITHLDEAYGVIDEDIYFTEMDPEYAVGVYVEYNAVPCKKDDFKWRCLETTKTEKVDRQKMDQNSQEYVDNEENFKDRNGLSILNREQLSFRLYNINQQAELNIVFENTGDTPYRLLNLYFYYDQQRPYIHTKSFRPVIVNAHSKQEVRIFARAKRLTNHTEYAIALFNRDMCLVTPVKIAVGSDAMIPRLAVVENQYRAARMKAIPDVERPQATQIFRVARTAPKFVHLRIKKYPLPELVWQLMCLDSIEFEARCDEEFPYMKEPLDPFNYKERLRKMIEISEAYLKKCFLVYEMKDLRFEKEGKFFCLRLENLAESRPSVLLEDCVRATETGGGQTAYDGKIKKILNDRVLFEFADQFVEAHIDRRYDVVFFYNRAPFRKMHHALDEICKAEKFGEDFLFPLAVEEKPPLLDVSYDCKEDESGPLKIRDQNGEVIELPWQNKELNWYQKKAIVNALRGECRPLPHLICGPPGTGKTSTLVELILQQYLNSRSTHMLVCTPSNSAANLILEKLINAEQLVRDHFIRVIGFQARERELIPDHLLPYCGTVEKGKDGTEGLEMNILDDGFRENCQMEYLSNFRIIVMTIGSAGTFMEMGFPENHFTHLYVDEAGQCLETEIIIPMSLLNKATGHLVFVGDEKQLGPVVMFKPLVTWNYGVSLFERLQTFPIYNRTHAEHDQRLCIQLVNNYRSVPKLLDVYNRIFYDETLKAMVSGSSKMFRPSADCSFVFCRLWMSPGWNSNA